MTTAERLRLTRSLTRHLSRAGFRNIRSKDRAHEAPPPLDGTGCPIVPDVITRSSTGGLSIYLVVSPDELSAEEPTERVRAAAEAAEQHGARFWLAVPDGERERAREQLDAFGIHARLLQV